MSFGWVIRIAYSFIALFAGNLLFSALYLAYEMVNCWRSGLTFYDAFYLCGMLLIYFVFSLAGWLFMGVPFALAVTPRRVIGLHPVLAFLMGAVAGLSSMFLLLITVLRGGFSGIGGAAPYFLFAAIIGAFFTYVYRLFLLHRINRILRPTA